MRRPLLGRALLLAALSLPAAAWSAAPVRGGGRSGGLFPKVSPALAMAIHHTIESKGFSLPGFKGLPPEHQALRPLASVLQDPEGFMKLDEPARQKALLQAHALAATAVRQKTADLVTLAAKDDIASLSEAVGGLGAIERHHAMFFTDAELTVVASVRGPAAEKLAALTMERAKKTAKALGDGKNTATTEGQGAVFEDTRRVQAKVLLERVRNGRGKTDEYDESLTALVALTRKGPDEGLERLILKGLLSHLDKAEDGRKAVGKHDYLALREVILEIARDSFFENSQLLALRGLAADARSGWRPNGPETLFKLGRIALATRSRRVKSETRTVLVDALNAPGSRDDDAPNLEFGALVTRLSDQVRTRAEHDAGPWDAQPAEKPFLLERVQDISPRTAWLLAALFGALSLAGLLLKSPLMALGFLIPIIGLAEVFAISAFRDLGERRRLIALIGERLTRADRTTLALPSTERSGLFSRVKLRGPQEVRPLKDLSKGELEALERDLRERETRAPLILDN